MALRQIRQYGDDILTKKAKLVKVFDSTLHRLIDDMWDTLREHDGLGLAAPQVGILRRLIVIELEDEAYELINPVVVESTGNEVKLEACLSIPNKQGEVERPTFIKLEAVDRYGEPFMLETDDDMLTTAICHEMDHLEGILFLDRAIKIQDRPDEEVRKSRQGRKNAMGKDSKQGETKRHKIRGGKMAAGR